VDVVFAHHHHQRPLCPRSKLRLPGRFGRGGWSALAWPSRSASSGTYGDMVQRQGRGSKPWLVGNPPTLLHGPERCNIPVTALPTSGQHGHPGFATLGRKKSFFLQRVPPSGQHLPNTVGLG
jgi:hypothetical protein